LATLVVNVLSQFAPVHPRAVWQLQFAVEADWTFRIKPTQSLHEQPGGLLVGTRPDQV
jgi:hypothetical protein